MHKFTVWLCLICETLHYIAAISPSFIYPFPPPASLQISPLFLIGVLSVILGTYIRLDCFHTLSDFFTIDLAVHPEHKLITSRFYAYVRHPSYTGSLLVVAGLTFSHLTQGSWVTSWGPLHIPGMPILVWALWWAWTLCVVFGRADAEDKMMHKIFGAEWEMYAARVPWSFFPGMM
jgi:protein-S-isoprenylcysteine O-methyltransferase Ste14